jgi:hypothetical protein
MASSSATNFTFINLSHPDELKEKKTIGLVRSTAMAHFGRVRKVRNRRNAKTILVFELQPPEYVPPDASALSRVGLETLDPFASFPFPINAYASRLYTNCRFHLTHLCSIKVYFPINAFKSLG